MARAASRMGEAEKEARETIIEMILYDLHVREFSVEKLGLPEAQTDFYFGRPLFYLVQTFGLQFQPDRNGMPNLVRRETSGGPVGIKAEPTPK